MLGGERLCRRPDSKTKLRLARYKQNLRFKNPFCCLASYSKQAYLSSTPRLFQGKSSDGWWLPAPRDSHPSEDLSELPPLRDPATRWFPNVMDYSDLKQGCGWTGVPLCPFQVMAAPGAARFLQAAVTRSYRTGLYARPIMIIRWDLLIMSVYHGAAPESALALRAGKGGCY